MNTPISALRLGWGCFLLFLTLREMLGIIESMEKGALKMGDTVFLIYASGEYESDGMELTGFVRDEETAKAVCERLNKKSWTQSIEYGYMELDDLSKTEI